MSMKFDLQLFADESAETTEQQDNTTDVTESTASTENEPSEAGEQHDEPIPDELAGVSEETAREIMAEAANTAEEHNDEENTDNTSTEETSSAEADSDTKQSDDPQLPNQSIPYGRFKQQVDKVHQLEEQLKAYQQKLNSQQQSVPQQVQQPQQIQQQPPAQPQAQFTPEVIDKLKQAATQEAMRMTGMSKDDLDSMEYMDDTDPRKQGWQTAYNLAMTNVYTGIRQAQQQRIVETQKFLSVHNKCVQDFNNFYREKAAEPDYNDIVSYANNDYFNSLSESEQPVVAAAYQRIERNLASPQDIMLIKRYYTDAQTAYRSQHPVTTAKKNSNPMDKVKQAKSFPRSQSVSGSADVGGNITAEQLEKMLDTMPFDKIPEQYQNMLLGK